MERTIGQTSLELWESHLADAARRFARRLGVLSATPQPGCRELEATLLRLGVAPDEVEALTVDPNAVCPERRAQLRTLLRHELDGLARRARVGRFDYDLNRHIAVYRAACRLNELIGQPLQTRASPRPSRPQRAARSSSAASCARASMRR